jgi:hypothetical protein
MRRWIFFLLSIVLGVGIGMFFGWVVQPIEFTNTTYNSLREDFRTDYVLMTAETYSLEQSTPAAIRRLTALSDTPALEQIRQAILFAEEAGYNDQDLGYLRSLQSALEAAGAQSGLQTP